jgi:hypothetical protein
MLSLKRAAVTITASFLLAVLPFAAAMTEKEGIAESTAAQRAYQHVLFDSLIATATPRALILAAMAEPTLWTGVRDQVNQTTQRDKLFQQAAWQAPDDAFVQWFTATGAHQDSVRSDSADALLRIEPDNGAAWIFQLNAAASAKNYAEVTAALAGIGNASRFDDRLEELTLEWLAILRKHPPPFNADSVDGNAGIDPAAIPLIGSIAHAAAVAIPAYKSLIDSCRPGDAPLPADRGAACTAAGRLITNKATTFSSRSIGLVLLRNTSAAEYESAARHLAHLQQQSIELSNNTFANPIEVARFEADLGETGSEIQVIERQLVRAGKPLAPPEHVD